jgi:hypothetical protein
MTCDANPPCGLSYRSYIADKAHVYRQRFDLLQVTPVIQFVSDPTRSMDETEHIPKKLDADANEEVRRSNSSSSLYVFNLRASFRKNGRVLRFLYAILFGEKRYLSNTARKLVQEKPINMYAE